jgi:hypothetical protein
MKKYYLQQDGVLKNFYERKNFELKKKWSNLDALSKINKAIQKRKEYLGDRFGNNSKIGVEAP